MWLTRSRREGHKLIYLDECVITRRSVSESEYTLPKQNVMIDKAKLNEPTLAVLSGISKERGQEHYRIFEKSVNNAKFEEYLTGLRAANGDKKIALFMDKLSVHRSDASKAVMKRLGFRAIYCVAYSPELNPI